jgi:hypothetical protein
MGKIGFGKPKVATIKNVHTNENAVHIVKASELSFMGEASLMHYLNAHGFNIPDNTPLHEMRRAYLAHAYRPLFDSVSIRTAISSDVLFAFFIMEATREGIESPMFADTWNPGGVKYRGRFTPYYSYDDCFENGKSVPCAFENPGNFENAVELWAQVFNSERYLPCKNKNERCLPCEVKSIEQTCKCLEDAGYHTAKSYKQRSRIAKSYRNYLKWSPDA